MFGQNFDRRDSVTGQLVVYLNSLGPTDPSAAPNWSNVPPEPGVWDGSRVHQNILGQTQSQFSDTEDSDNGPAGSAFTDVHMGPFDTPKAK